MCVGALEGERVCLCLNFDVCVCVFEKVTVGACVGKSE